MRAFLAAVAAAVVISIGAALILTTVDQSAGQRFATDSVRLGGER